MTHPLHDPPLSESDPVIASLIRSEDDRQRDRRQGTGEYDPDVPVEPLDCRPQKQDRPQHRHKSVAEAFGITGGQLEHRHDHIGDPCHQRT